MNIKNVTNALLCKKQNQTASVILYKDFCDQICENLTYVMIHTKIFSIKNAFHKILTVTLQR